MEKFSSSMWNRERAQERQRIADEVQNEGLLGTLSRKIKESIQSEEDYLGESDMSLFRAAGYSAKELKWIAAVKKESKSKFYDDGARRVNAYDLVRLQAMLATDSSKSRKFEEYGRVEYSDKTADYLDEILSRIGKRYSIWENEYEEALIETKRLFGDSFSIKMVEKCMIDIADHRYGSISAYEMRVISCYVRWKMLTNPIEKARLFTDWLGVVHLGGNREVLDLFSGIPGEREAKDFKQSSGAKDEFLKMLNSLGKNK